MPPLANRARGFMRRWARRARVLVRPEKIEILQLPKAVIGRVIGKAGATIRDIRERTGARIDARDQTEDPVQAGRCFLGGIWAGGVAERLRGGL